MHIHEIGIFMNELFTGLWKNMEVLFLILTSQWYGCTNLKKKSQQDFWINTVTWSHQTWLVLQSVSSAFFIVACICLSIHLSFLSGVVSEQTVKGTQDEAAQCSRRPAPCFFQRTKEDEATGQQTRRVWSPWPWGIWLLWRYEREKKNLLFIIPSPFKHTTNCPSYTAQKHIFQATLRQITNPLPHLEITKDSLSPYSPFSPSPSLTYFTTTSPIYPPIPSFLLIFLSVSFFPIKNMYHRDC